MKRLIPILVLCGLLSSCATKRQAEPRRYQTLSQKANVTLQFDQRAYSMNCSVQMWRNELIVLSLQPVLGIEMFRLEATPDSMVVIDKMNRRYTTMAYDWGGKQLQPTPSFKMIQNFITPPALPKIKASSGKSFEVGNHRISIDCTFWQRDYNTLTEPKRIDLKKYKRVSLRDILPL
jgi:hypothetical protein